jgi:hypothetical protein
MLISELISNKLYKNNIIAIGDKIKLQKVSNIAHASFFLPI